jgi:hypothetical protein
MTLRRIQRGHDRPMADENIDLRFLAEQGKRILDELAEASRTAFMGLSRAASELPLEAKPKRASHFC